MQGLIFPLICIGLVALLLIINYIAVTRQERRNPPSPPAEIDWDALDDDALQTALVRGNKIEAIKRYRELTGLGLKDAKDAIDHAALHPDERAAKKKKAAYDSQDAGIRDLIKEGRLTEAVEVYQKFAGVDAYTARDAVAQIEQELHQSTHD